MVMDVVRLKAKETCKQNHEATTTRNELVTLPTLISSTLKSGITLKCTPCGVCSKALSQNELSAQDAV